MADELNIKRIIELQQKTAPEEGDSFAVDNANSGTSRITIQNLLDPTFSSNLKAAPAEETKKKIDEVMDVFAAGIDEAVDNWLDQHPEATTTVQDGSLSLKKFIETELPFVTPQMYGAMADGVNDDTPAIKRALEVGNVYFPYGTYNVNTQYVLSPIENSACIVVPSNRILFFSNGAKLKAINRNASTGTMLLIANSTNISIINGNFTGDVEENTNTDEGGNNGIYIRDSSDIVVSYCKFNNCFTDGLSMIRCSNIVIDHCDFDHNGRGGMVCTCGESITISNCVIKDSFRVAPKYGISLEPNYGTDYLKDILIEDCIVYDCVLGYYFNLNKITNSPKRVEITYKNCTAYYCDESFEIGNFNPVDYVTGNVLVDGFKSIESKGSGIYVRHYSKNNTPNVKFTNFVIADGNQNNYTAANGSAIAGINTDADNAGNVEFVDGRLYSNDGKMFLRCISTGGCKYMNINFEVFDTTNSDTEYIGGFPSSIKEITEDGAITINGDGIIIANNVSQVTLRKAQYLIGRHYEILSKSNNVAIRVNNNLLGLCASGQTISTNTPNAYLLLKKINTDDYIVVSKYGEWVVNS